MAGKVKAVPEGFRTVTPHLVVRDAAGAIQFYKSAFSAEEICRSMTPDDKYIMHATVKIGDSLVMLCDEMPMMQRWLAPPSLNGTTVGLCLYVEDADALYKRAVAAGATVSMPLEDQFWGDRFGKVTDPYGHEWEIVTHKKDLTPEEISKGAQEFFSKMSKH